ncbi:hypothetical protein [Cyclobacterium sp.]|uniref:hypothetical protein n=1 Tax=Cyclobacterium sp. TaxID=1966343 RepID=UPI0019AAF560|nr:hypothetical protein [Cyclobacterium sp.]MBD3630982.1 short-chain dehydrogenase [Cyclobacterium sp.]
MNDLELEYFLFNLPIYTPIQITKENRDNFIFLLSYGRGDNQRDVEGYNPFRKTESTFNGWSNINENIDYFVKYGGTDGIGIKCKRYGDVLKFYINYNPEKHILMKVGQYPSIADFHIQELNKYRRVLDKTKLKEFSKSIGLAANGIGIGSYVYLRRIFETLIVDAKNMAESDGAITDDDYQKVRVEDRIKLLAEYLPNFLVENKSMYSILSLGIHELDEETCLAHFDSLRVGIEIILDEKLEEIRKKEKTEEAKKRLAAIKGKLK